MQPRFTIGTQYNSAGKHKRLCTVTDILSTYNAAGELVSIRYVATHDFMGQVVTERDVVDATIARGIESLNEGWQQAGKFRQLQNSIGEADVLVEMDKWL